MKITYCYGRRDRMNSIGNSTLVFSTFYAYAQIYYDNTGKIKESCQYIIWVTCYCFFVLFLKIIVVINS